MKEDQEKNVHRGKLYRNQTFTGDMVAQTFCYCGFVDCIFDKMNLTGTVFRDCTFIDTDFMDCINEVDAIDLSCSFFGEVTLPELEE